MTKVASLQSYFISDTSLTGLHNPRRAMCTVYVMCVVA